jgi:hypothetical protein
MPTKTDKNQHSSAPDWTPSSLADWKRRATMDVTLSSGARVRLRALTIDELAAADGLPNDLVRVALLEQLPGGVVAEIAGHLENDDDPAAFAAAQKLSQDTMLLRDRLVLLAVVEPQLTERDLAKIDPFDKAEIAEYAQRKRVVDSAGRRVGADALSTFRTLAEEHACDPDCPACAAAIQRICGVQP